MFPWLKTIDVCTSLSAALLTQAMAYKICIGRSTLSFLRDISECAGSCWFAHKLFFSSCIGTSLHILNRSRWSCCHAIQSFGFKLKALTRMYFFLWQPHPLYYFWQYSTGDQVEAKSEFKKGDFAHCGEKAGSILLMFCFRGTFGTFLSISKRVSHLENIETLFHYRNDKKWK